MSKIRIGIVGYGNLGRGVELAVAANPDQELVAVFSRRDPASVKIVTEGVPVCRLDEIESWKGKVDVMILCGGSATDLPTQTPALAAMFNVVDSFDTHAKIPAHFANVEAAAKPAGTVGIISVGWDPGMFSLNRLYAECILPQGMEEKISESAQIVLRTMMTGLTDIQKIYPNLIRIQQKEWRQADAYDESSALRS